MSSLLEQQFRNKWAMWAALGAGCLVGMTGLHLVQRLALRIEQTSTQGLSHELASLHSTIKELQQEIRHIKKPPLKSALRTVTFSDVKQSLDEKEEIISRSTSSRTSTTEYYSAISSNDDEFFDLPSDLPSDGELTPTNETINNGGSLSSTNNTNSNGNGNLVEKALERLENELVELDPIEQKKLKLFQTVDELMEGQAEQQKLAFDLLNSQDCQTITLNPDYLWRMCKSMYLMAVVIGQEGDSAKKQSLIFEAVDYGLKAIEIDELNSEAHKWYAIVIGSRGEYLGIKEKILDGYEFKKHIDRAADLSPQDHTIRHLLGRFCYEVAELSWWERKMASTLFADPPNATMDEAKEHFMAAEQLKPDGWKENRQFLAKSCIHLKDYSAALHWLDQANELPVKNPDDQQAQNDIDELLMQYQSYR